MIRLLALAVVLLEIASLVLMGQAVGVLLTLLLVVLAAVAGAMILKRQGREAVMGLRGALDRGRDPRPVLLRGGFRVVAALLLIAPGFAGDLIALALLLPPVQLAVGAALARRGLRMAAGPLHSGPPRMGPGPRPPAPSSEPVLDADWEEIAPPKRPTHRPSGWTRH